MKSNNTHLNILASFAYLAKNKEFTNSFINLSKVGKANIMIDSGAYTLHNATNDNFNHITLDNYCNFVEAYGEYSEKYVMLDVINNDTQSKINYETMLKRGLNPMYVFTSADNDFEYLSHAVKNNSHVCVAGGTVTKGMWMIKRYQDVYRKTKAKIHGLGYLSFPEMFQLPLCSVDASTWIQNGQRFGYVSYWDDVKGPRKTRYVDILTKTKKLTTGLIQEMDKLGITPAMFSNLDMHRGRRSISNFLSIVTYIKFIKYSKKRNLNLFLAVANKTNIDDIVWFDDQLNANTLTYEGFRKADTASYCKNNY